MINCLRDSVHVLMSVLFCKIHSLLLCFSNPFSHCEASTLKMDNTTHASLKNLVSATSDDDDDDHEELVDHVDGLEVKEEQEDGMVDAKEEAGGDDTLTLKSSLKKDENREKKKVQWVDMIGKELAEIREFEPSEEDEYDSDRGKACVCVIL